MWEDADAATAFMAKNWCEDDQNPDSHKGKKYYCESSSASASSSAITLLKSSSLSPWRIPRTNWKQRRETKSNVRSLSERQLAGQWHNAQLTDWLHLSRTVCHLCCMASIFSISGQAAHIHTDIHTQKYTSNHSHTPSQISSQNNNRKKNERTENAMS